MGVDARMFVRLSGRDNWLKEDDVLSTSYALASTIGADNFVITATFEDWPWEKHHALSIIAPMSEEEAFQYYEPDFAGKVVWQQDGRPIVAPADVQFVEVSLRSRFYGENYARGDWPVLRSIIEWLWIRFPTGEVWYGGDSSGICAEAMTRDRVDAVNTFFLRNGHKSYTRYESPFLSAEARTAPSCRVCRVPMINCGGGHRRRFFSCDGCDSQAITVDGSAEPHWLARGKDFFSASQEIAS